MEIKRIKIENNNNNLSLRRDSFSDRFCDDLTEVLLSYLSFEDKIRFECVSQQFQRLIFNKQYVLQVFQSENNIKNSLNELFLEIKRTRSVFKEIDLIAFESVLKKCKFIKEIVINIFGIESKNREKVLQLITKYVKHLKTFDFDFKDINEKVLLDFGEKCGQKIEEIFLLNFNNYVIKSLIKLCPNIRSLTNVRLEDMIENNDILVSKLSSIHSLITDFNESLFEIFIKKTENSLKCLGIKLNTDMNEVLAQTISQTITKFVNLNRFVMDLNIESDCVPSFANILHNIGIKCKKISDLDLCICNITSEPFDAQDFEFFQTFTQLQQLRLNFCTDLTLMSLKNCKQLTQLKVHLRGLHYQNVFNHIHIYLPQLTHLCCRVDWDITDSQLKTLSKLKHLKCLTIRSVERKYFTSTDESICDIINNCKDIESIRFGSIPDITDKTIDSLISLAEEKPFCDFIHSFGPKPYESEEDFDYIEFLTDKTYEQLPNNLKIIPSD